MAAVTNTLTDKVSISYSGNGATVSSQVGTYSGTSDAGLAVVVPAGSTNLEFDINFPQSTIQSLIIASDQDVTVNVNSSSIPAPALTVKKTAAIIWGADYANACPLTEAVTKIYVTNPGTVDAKFNLRVLYNKLP